MPEVCPNCESSEITLYDDRSGKCRRCSRSFASPKTVDVVSPKPFSEAMASPSRQEDEGAVKDMPGWRRSYEPGQVASSPSPAWRVKQGAYSAPPSSYTRPSAAPKWGRAIGYGFLASLLGGFLWGLISLVTGYIFIFGAIAIGLGIGWAVKTGAGQTSNGVIAITIMLTLFAIFIGDIVAITMVLSGYGLSLFDAIVNYPKIVSLAPGQFCLGYAFGIGGALYAAYYLWKQKIVESRRIGTPSGQTWMPSSYSSIQAPPVASTTPDIRDSGRPQVQVVARTSTKAQLQVRFSSPAPQIVDALYETMLGRAVVSVNGMQVAKARVWGSEKAMEIPLAGIPKKMLKVRFYGMAVPRIEMSVEGVLVATC